jgi:signal recognition particle subunit SRP54
MGKAIKNLDIDNDSFKHVEAIIRSMTPRERSNPDILNSSRKRRIAEGSGTSVQEVNQLIKQFADTRKMMKLMSNKKNMASLMKQMGGGGIPGLN